MAVWDAAPGASAGASFMCYPYVVPRFVRSLRHAIVMAIALTACQSDRIALLDVPVHLQSNDVWSGDQIRVSYPNVLTSAHIPRLVFGSDTITLGMLDNNTLAASAPATGGTFDAHLIDPYFDLGTLTVHGFLGFRTGLILVGAPIVPPGVRPRVLMLGADGAVEVDLGTGNAQTVLALQTGSNCLGGGIGPSPRGAAIVASRRVNGVCERILAFAKSAAGTYVVVDTGPQAVGLPAAYMGNGRWVSSHKSFLVIEQFRTSSIGATGALLIDYHAAWSFVVSSGGDRVLPFGYDRSTPVIDAPNLRVAYRIPRRVGGAEFNSSGDSLFLATRDSARVDRLEVRATDGSMLASSSLPGFGQHLLLDPAGRWIFVTGGYTQSGVYAPVVWVYDRQTLQHVATMSPTKSTAPIDSENFALVAVANPIEHKLHVLFSRSAAAEIRIFDFGLP